MIYYQNLALMSVLLNCQLVCWKKKNNVESAKMANFKKSPKTQYPETIFNSVPLGKSANDSFPDFSEAC